MNVFTKNYSNFYDLFYQDKDYKKECDFIEQIISQEKKKVKTILSLGCGTGSHEIILAERGYKVTGVDISGSMLSLARKKAEAKGLDIRFLKEDITKLKLAGKFDLVISMFAVMGYQITNEAFVLACSTSYNHLRKNGLFIFDCWYGPAVLNDRPREKKKNSVLPSGEKIIRYTKPVMDTYGQFVEVNFTVEKWKNNKKTKKIKESHLMRFFFAQELDYFLKTAGFKDMKIIPFMLRARSPVEGQLNSKVTEKNWNITIITKK